MTTPAPPAPRPPARVSTAVPEPPATVVVDQLPVVAGTRTAWDVALPMLMLSTLERRYLAAFEPSTWDISSRRGDVGRPLLRAVAALGRSDDEAAVAGMPHVLHACHEPGQALILVLHSDGSRQRFYLGGRRVIGDGGGNTAQFLNGVDGAFKSYLPGLETGPLTRLDNRGMPALSELLQNAPALAAITGVPSRRRGAGSSSWQNLDRLAATVGSRAYTVMVVAEALPPPVLDESTDRCRRLKSDVHAYARWTVSRTAGESEGTTQADQPGQRQSSRLPYGLFGLATFLELAGVFVPGLSNVGAGFTTIGQGVNFSRQSQIADRTQRSQTTSSSFGSSAELLDANALACEELLDQHLRRLEAGRRTGWWRVGVYVAAEDEGCLREVTAAYRALASGDEAGMEPLRAVRLPAHLLRGPMELGQLLAMRPAGSDQGHPLGPAYDALGTCMSSEELAVTLCLPRQELPGLPVRDRARFAVAVPERAEHNEIELGVVLDHLNRTTGPFSVPSGVLNRHVFVTGVTGAGKTNTCMQLLAEAHQRWGVPFLVIEPSKAEYRELARWPGLRDRLRVFSVGGDSSHALRLNALNPASGPGISLGLHIDLLKAVFNASFPMFAGMPYVLEDALHEIYRTRGWRENPRRDTPDNPFLSTRPTLDERSALMPCMSDLHDKIEEVLARRGYASEVHQNMGAALRSRIESLLVGNKGLVLDSPRSTPLDRLFGAPAVIELQDLGDDEEKAFVMAVLLMLLYEYARVRPQGPRRHQELAHLTLVEEAHRLLRAPGGQAHSELGDPGAKAVSMFTDMLAEMRAAGEGFIIADQIPSDLAPEVLKNSSLKILHRLVAPDDRDAAGGTINLDERQRRHLVNLATGEAVMHDERVGEAVLVRVHPFVDGLYATPPSPGTALAGETKSHLYRHAGCKECPSPCDFYPSIAELRAPGPPLPDLGDLFDSLLAGDVDRGWSAWCRWRHALAEMQPPRLDPVEARGIAYCGAAAEAQRWLGNLLTVRRSATGTSALTPNDRLKRELASARAAPLLAAWTAATELDGAAREAFAQAAGQLAPAVTSAPPRELPGCAGCPARCRALAAVAPHVARLRAGVLAKAAADLPVADRVVTIRVAAQGGTGPLSGAEGREQRETLYCLVSNCAGTTVSPAVKEVLSQLAE